jgi:hypothetical protein
MASQVINPGIQGREFSAFRRDRISCISRRPSTGEPPRWLAATKSKASSWRRQKPWRQKGTGRARGSIPLADLGRRRHDLRPDAARLFLPHAEDGAQEALLSALSMKRKEGKIIVARRLRLAERRPS